jgi:transposase-like protein
MTAELDRVKAASGRLQKVSDWQSEARHEFESAIHDAYKSGTSTRQIARVAGISHARIFQIVKEQ